MKVSVGDRLEGFVASLVAQGRYGSSSEVVREGLRLVEEREAKFNSLRGPGSYPAPAAAPASRADVALNVRRTMATGAS